MKKNIARTIFQVFSTTLFLLLVLNSRSTVTADESQNFPLLDQVVIYADAPPDGEERVVAYELQDKAVMMDSDPQAAALAVLESGKSSGNGILHWKSGDATLEPGLETGLVSLAQAALTAQDPTMMAYVVVQYASLIEPSELEVLQALGFRELDIIPEDGAIIAIPANNLPDLAALPIIYAVSPLREEWKYDPAQVEGCFASNSLCNLRIVAFEPLILNPNSPLNLLEGSLYYEGWLTHQELSTWLKHPLVKWIEPVYENQLETATSSRVIGANKVWGQGLDGTGVQVGIIDSGINRTHPHFNISTVIYAHDWVEDDNLPFDCHGHGTHVAGIIGGSGTFNNQTFQGMASGATLIIERILNCSNNSSGGLTIAQLFDEVADRGADVINNSWGFDSNGAYETWASGADAWARSHPNVVVVFGNGNSPDTDDMGSPALAKNVIAVGATEEGSPSDSNPPNLSSAPNVDLVSTINNLNLPDDGRTKPDVNAPGVNITSPILGTNYGTWNGTSMAAPHVSGLVALYLDAYPGASAAQVKAALINSAAYLANKPGQTSFPQGWGRVNAFDFIYRLENESTDMSFSGTVGEAAYGYATEQSFTVNVPTGAVYLKVTMTYLDAAASVNANPALVNDLDMRIVGPNGTYYSSSGVNNVEQIFQLNPAAGTWTIYISSFSTPGTETHQAYAGRASVVTQMPSLTNTVPSSVTTTQGTPVGIPISRNSSGWFANGVWTTVESLNANIQLASGSQSGNVIGDMFLETRLWTPSFVASACGTYNDVIRVTMGATSFGTVTSYVDVIVTCPPGAFNKISPSDNAPGQPTNPTISWGSSTGVTSYQYCLDTNINNACNTSWISNGTSTSKALSSLNPGTPYEWQVRAINSAGTTYANSSASAFWTFTTASSGDGYEPDNSSGQAKTILSGIPQTHSIVPATDIDWVKFTLFEESQVVLETSGSIGDTRMWLYNSSLGDVEYDDDDGAGNFSLIDRLCNTDALPAGTYYVKIDEYNNNDEIDSYNILYSTTPCLRTTPVPSSPTGALNGVAKPTFVWSTFPDASSYKLAVWSDAAMAYLVQAIVSSTYCNATQCSYVSPINLANGNYRFKVMAYIPGGATPYSDWLAFTITGVTMPPPTVPPTLIAPNTTVDAHRPTFQWNAVENATFYRLAVYSYATRVYEVVENVYPSCVTGICSYSPYTWDLVNGSYGFKMRSRNSSGYTEYGTMMKFSVSSLLPVAPTLIAPTGTVGTARPEFQWGEVSGATKYRLLVYSVASGSYVISTYVYPSACVGGVCSYVPSSDLASGGYKFKMMTYNAYGSSGYSAFKSFAVP